MIDLRSKAWKKAAGALAVSTGLCAGLGLLAVHQAAADPGTATAYAGVGSDTTQDVMDALAGQSPWAGAGSTSAPKFFTPILSSAATSSKQIVSWDAIPFGGSATAPGCITPKYGAPAMDRPNGSSAGINALNAAINGTGWVNSVSTTCTVSSVTIGAANLDFARSSRGPNNTTTSNLTFVPFARDAVMYVYESNGPDDLHNLTTAQLASVYTTANTTIGATTVAVCLPQAGSGTRSFWEGAIGVADNLATTAANANSCNALEEHGGNSFHTAAQAYLAGGANRAMVFPFSVSQFVAQGNGFGVDRSATFRASAAAQYGDPDNISGGIGPFSGTAGTYAGNASFYNFNSGATVGTYGRDVYNVFKTSKLGSALAGGDAGIQSLFNTGTNANATGLCVSASARTIVHNFGFRDPAACGSTVLTGNS